MFEILDQPAADVLAVRITGTVDEADYERLVTGRLASGFRSSLILVLEDFEGWRGHDEALPHRPVSEMVRRVALVGRRGSWVWRMAATFVDADVRYFEPERLSDACAWLGRAHRSRRTRSEPESPRRAAFQSWRQTPADRRTRDVAA